MVKYVFYHLSHDILKLKHYNLYHSIGGNNINCFSEISMFKTDFCIVSFRDLNEFYQITD